MNIREISKLAGVSPAAVSIVINNRKGVSASTREHVKRIMEQYNYHPQKKRF
ncbi:MAG: LacI family DNA-binding transcriptional regulator [[Clostridium] leptum]